MWMRWVVLSLALLGLGCGSSTPSPQPLAQEAVEVRTPESMLPADPDLYLRVTDVGALERAFTPELLRQLGRLDVGAVVTEYGGDKVVVVSARGPAIARPEGTPQRETAGGGFVFPRGLGRVLVAYPRHDVYVVGPRRQVERIDAVVRGEAPSLEGDAVFSSGRLDKESALYGFARRHLGPPGGTTTRTTITFSLEDEERARLSLRARVPGLEGEAILPVLRRLPDDTVAFEAHTFPSSMPPELEQLYGRWAPKGRGTLEDVLGFTLEGAPDPRGKKSLVAVVVPQDRREAPLLELMQFGAVVGLLTPVEGQARETLFASWRSQASARWGAEAVVEDGDRIEVDAEGRLVWLRGVGADVWMGAGAPDVCRRVMEQLDGASRTPPVTGIDDVSAVAWIEPEWATVPESMADQLLVRARPGEQVTTLRMDDGEVAMTIDLGMLQTVVTLAIKAVARPMLDALKRGSQGQNRALPGDRSTIRLALRPWSGAPVPPP